MNLPTEISKILRDTPPGQPAGLNTMEQHHRWLITHQGSRSLTNAFAHRVIRPTTRPFRGHGSSNGSARRDRPCGVGPPNCSIMVDLLAATVGALTDHNDNRRLTGVLVEDQPSF